MTLAVVMPVYNHIADTLIALDTLEATTRCEVIIVDDGSTDGTRKALLQRHVTYITNPRNLGVNASWNIGIRSAIAAGAEYIAVVNNDLAFSPGWWPPLRSALDSGHAVVSPYSTERLLPPDWPLGADRHVNPFAAMPILGSCFAFKPSLIERIGYFPQAMRHYCGDDWLVEVCRREGLKVGHIRESYVHHYCMTTTRDLPSAALIADRKAYEDYKERTWR